MREKENLAGFALIECSDPPIRKRPNVQFLEHPYKLDFHWTPKPIALTKPSSLSSAIALYPLSFKSPKWRLFVDPC